MSTPSNSASPLSEPDKSAAYCNSLYWSLLYSTDANTSARFIIDKLYETRECDHVYSLTHVRDTLVKNLGNDNVEMVLSGSRDPVVREKAEDALFSIRVLMQSELYSALPFWGKVEYHTGYRWDKWVCGNPLFGKYAGGHFRLNKRMAERQQQQYTK